MTRIYKDYIDACVEASADSPIPKIFRRWAALSSVADFSVGFLAISEGFVFCKLEKFS